MQLLGFIRWLFILENIGFGVAMGAHMIAQLTIGLLVAGFCLTRTNKDQITDWLFRSFVANFSQQIFAGLIRLYYRIGKGQINLIRVNNCQSLALTFLIHLVLKKRTSGLCESSP